MEEHEWLASTDPAAMLRELLDYRPPGSTGGSWGSTRRPGVSDRKLRLFACGCCRLVWDKLTDPRSRRAVEVAERAAEDDGRLEVAWLDWRDGTRDAPDWLREWSPCASNATEAARRCLNRADLAAAQADLLRCVFGNPWRPVDIDEGLTRTQFWQLTVVPLAEAAYESRRSVVCGRCKGEKTIPSYTGMYRLGSDPCPDCGGTGRVSDGLLDNDALAVLADALSDAGCENEAMLRHLRGWERCSKCLADPHYDNGQWVPRAFCTGCDGSGWLRSHPPHARGCHVLDCLLGKG